MSKKNHLPTEFYTGSDPTFIARGLLGKLLCRRVENVVLKAMIVETEAYSHQEKACHAYNLLRTKRTDTMFLKGGVFYVYLCYGVHHMLNVVTNVQGIPDAVLIRAVEPLDGVKRMQSNRKKNNIYELASGPGKTCQAMQVNLIQNAKPCSSADLWIEEGQNVNERGIGVSKRIGVDYAGEDAHLPWRFYLKMSKFVSRYNTK